MNDTLKSIAINILTSGIPKETEFDKKITFVALNSLSIAAVLILIGFALKRLLQSQYNMTIIDFSVATCLIIIVLTLRKIKKTLFPAIITTSLMAFFFWFLYFDGSIEKTGALWTLGFPFLAYLLLGKNIGTIFSLLFLLFVTLITTNYDQVPFYKAHYSTDFFAVYFFTYLMFILLAYIPEATRVKIVQMLSLSNRKIEKVNAKLEDTNRELRRFVQIGSHHLQEPLRMVASYIQLLEQRYKGKLDSEADVYIDYAVDGVIWMKHLISDLVSYSDLTRKEIELSSTDCNTAFKYAVNNLQGKIDRLNGVVTHSMLPTIMANELEFVRLFQDLIGNALKFIGKEPPRIHVSAEKKSNTYFNTSKNINGYTNSDTWLFSVKDNGIGIAPKYTKRIFDIFEKLHTRTKYYGTGTGLSICKKIVERHGGHIWVESEEGKGSTFFFTVPAYKKYEQKGKEKNNNG